ncbi:MAG: hypothetical protein ACW9WZ_05235 [Nitrosopumilus sp.]
MDYELEFQAEKIFVHRWPHNTPEWSKEIKSKLDLTINKKIETKNVRVIDNFIHIENFKFDNLTKIGISIPFFKDECRMIFECQFDGLFAHIHITKKGGNYIEILSELIEWKKRFFPNDTN